MAGPTNSIKQDLNGGANAKPRAEPGTTISTGFISGTSARSGAAMIQRLEKQQKRVKNPQNPYATVARLEQAATKRGRSESDDEDDVEEEHRENRRRIDDTSFSPEKVAHRRSVQSTEKENDATGRSTPGNSPKKSAKKAPAPKPSSGKRKAILVDDSESDDGEATAPSAKKTAKDGEDVLSDTEEDVPTPKPKPTKTKKTVPPGDAEENEEPVAPVAKKRTARKTVPPGDAEEEAVKAPAVRPRKKTKRTVDVEDDEDAAVAPNPQDPSLPDSRRSKPFPSMAAKKAHLKAILHQPEARAIRMLKKDCSSGRRVSSDCFPCPYCSNIDVVDLDADHFDILLHVCQHIVDYHPDLSPDVLDIYEEIVDLAVAPSFLSEDAVMLDVFNNLVKYPETKDTIANEGIDAFVGGEAEGTSALLTESQAWGDDWATKEAAAWGTDWATKEAAAWGADWATKEAAAWGTDWAAKEAAAWGTDWATKEAAAWGGDIVMEDD